MNRGEEERMTREIAAKRLAAGELDPETARTITSLLQAGELGAAQDLLFGTVRESR